MSRTRRMGVAMLLAGTLAAVPIGVRAASGAGSSTATVTIGDFCGDLAEAIDLLEARPSSPLRDYLLELAQRIFARYCAPVS